MSVRMIDQNTLAFRAGYFGQTEASPAMSPGERAAAAALKAEREAEAVRLLDVLQRDDAAVRIVQEVVGWLW